MPNKQIRTSRLNLRDIRIEDVDSIVAFFAESDAQAFILSIQKYPEVNRATFTRIAEYSKAVERDHRHFIQFAVTLGATGELIGMCGATLGGFLRRYAMLGWHFSSSFSGCGYATEAISALIAYCFEVRSVERVYCDCFAGNSKNRRIFQKLGLEEESRNYLSKKLLSMKYGERASIVRFARSLRHA